MDAAESRLRGETSPMKKTGRIAVHVPEPALRKMELIGRAGAALHEAWNRGIRDGRLTLGQKRQDRVRVGFCTLQARLSAGSRRECDGGDCHPYPRAFVSGSGHDEPTSHIVP